MQNKESIGLISGGLLIRCIFWVYKCVFVGGGGGGAYISSSLWCDDTCADTPDTET